MVLVIIFQCTNAAINTCNFIVEWNKILRNKFTHFINTVSRKIKIVNFSKKVSLIKVEIIHNICLCNEFSARLWEGEGGTGEPSTPTNFLEMCSSTVIKNMNELK